ncbi:MAG: hypothetical protein WBI54_00645 [Flavobacteriaceae bacterium]
MKLLVITIIDAHKPSVLKLLKQAGISAYSSADISGHKESDQSSPIKNWFASSAIQVDSELVFSFVAEEKIAPLFQALRAFNKSLEDASPIHAVVVPIEQSL